jgi:hypothetical protein
MPSLIVFPATLPSALVQGRSFQQVPNARPRERDMGESRARPRYRRTEELVAVSWMLQQAQLDTFHDWYEDELIVGTDRFDLQLQGRGAEPFGMLWYSARFVGDYTAEFVPGESIRDLAGAVIGQRHLYRVSATLRLIEEIGASRTPPGIELLGGIVFGTGGMQFPAATLALQGGIVFGAGGMAFPSSALAAEGDGIVFGGGEMEMAGGEIDPSERVVESDESRVTEGGEIRWLG